jgi:hypothetical protein
VGYAEKQWQGLTFCVNIFTIQQLGHSTIVDAQKEIVYKIFEKEKLLN